MKKNKFEIKVIVIVIVFSIVIFLGYLLFNFFKQKNSYILFTKPFNILNCSWYSCESKSADINEYNNKKYDTYIDGKYVGNNSLYYNESNDNYYVFDSNNNNLFDNKSDYLETKNYLLGTAGNVSVSGKEILNEQLTEEDFKKLSKITNHTINYDINFLTLKQKADFDNDGELETIMAYNFSENDKYYSVIAYENDNQLKLVNLDTYNSLESRKRIFIEDIIDVYEDGKLEFLLVKFGDNDYCTALYRLKGNTFKSTGDC